MNCKTKLLALAGVLLVAAVAQADPKETFEKTCAKCHGADGTGQTKMGQKLGCRDYTDAKVSDSLKDDVAFKALKEGLTNDDGKTLMKPVQDLSDDDIKGLIASVRAFKK
jgi:cytochrome c553